MSPVRLLSPVLHAIGSSVVAVMRAHPPSVRQRRGPAATELGQSEAVTILVGLGLLVAGGLAAALLLFVLS